VAESIKAELEKLESLGRVSAHGHRPVHADFGFEGVEPEKQPAATGAPRNDVASNLDDAWSRLKQRINPE
jgi:hypothetical protein